MIAELYIPEIFNTCTFNRILFSEVKKLVILQHDIAFELAYHQPYLVQTSLNYAIPRAWRSWQKMIKAADAPPLNRLPDNLSPDEDTQLRWTCLLATHIDVQEEIKHFSASKFLLDGVQGFSALWDLESLYLS